MTSRHNLVLFQVAHGLMPKKAKELGKTFLNGMTGLRQFDRSYLAR
jgi:hypothetical protein